MDKQKLWLVVILAGVAYFAYSKAPIKMPAPVTPVNPQPVPTPPANPSKTKFSKILVVSQPNCHWCTKLKEAWPQVQLPPTEWIMNSAEISTKYKIEGVPTILIFDKDGNELRRQVGYLQGAELLAFLTP